MDPTVLILIVANVVMWRLTKRRRDRLNRRLPPPPRRVFVGSLCVIAVLLLVGSGIIALARWTEDTGGGVNFAKGGDGKGLDTGLCGWPYQGDGAHGADL